jgi:hypothetical protein
MTPLLDPEFLLLSIAGSAYFEHRPSALLQRHFQRCRCPLPLLSYFQDFAERFQCDRIP